MQLNILCEYWQSANKGRQAEMDFCIQSNASQSYTSKIILLLFSGATHPFHHPKIFGVPIPDRTYGTIFAVASKLFPGELCCVCNTDIYFEPELPLQLEATTNFDVEALALSRWDQQPDGTHVSFRTGGSYDAYLFKAPLLLSPDADFTPGTVGCDASLACLMSHQRQMKNPANTVRALHLHLVDFITYDRNNRLRRPYLVIPVT